MLIAGMLIGAILTTGGFLVFGKNQKSDFGNRGNRPDMSDFDANNLPEGFDPSNMPNRGGDRTTDGTDTDTSNTSNI